MVYVPAPTAGLKEFPLTPVPLKVPPAGVPESVTAAAFTQTGEYVPALTESPPPIVTAVTGEVAGPQLGVGLVVAGKLIVQLLIVPTSAPALS